MSGEFNFRIDMIDNGRVLVRLEALPESIRAKLRPVITRQTHTLLAQVEAAEPVVTGRLRSLTHAYIDEESSQRRNFIRGRVRILRTKEHNTAAAAGALEYGAHRRFEVRAHSRRGRRGKGNRAVRVHAYERRAHITAMRFLRGPAARLQPRFRAELNAVLEEAMKEFR